MVKPVLGYWYNRGLVEPLRYLLYYKNVDFEDRRYKRDGTWEKEKFTFDLDFPNLPYYIDEKVKLTQSTVILRYLAKKYDMDGKTEEEKLRVSLIEQQILDLRQYFFNTVASLEFEKLKPDFLKKLPDQLKLIAKFLGNRKYFAGDNITYVDFMVYDVFEFLTQLSKPALDDFPSLKAYSERIKNLPEIQKYLNSSICVKWPVVGPHNQWGGGGEAPK